MKRLHLVEMNDQAWLPASIRDAMTDYLQFVLNLSRPYAPILPRLRRALEQTRARQIVDLCSGSAGPWPTLCPFLQEPMPVEVQLTDKYPNLAAFRRAQAASGGTLRFCADSVDATAVPPGMSGFRTLFSSFHHFAPDQARAILEDAGRQKEGIGVFEGTQRSPSALLIMLVTPLVVLVVTPFIRPFRLSRLLWTYLIPLVPLLALFDGIVSCLRTYTPEELQALVDTLPPNATPYRWEIGEERPEKAGLPITYLLGYPKDVAA